MLHKIDQTILNFWFTNPDDRAWAYGMTFIIALFIVTEIVYLF